MRKAIRLMKRFRGILRRAQAGTMNRRDENYLKKIKSWNEKESQGKA